MLTAALALAHAPVASAIEPCANQPETRVVAKGLGVLESIVADRQGRIVFSESPREGESRLLRLNRAGGTPYPVVEDIAAPGGLILKGEHRLLVGSGNSLGGGTIGNLFPQASLYLADPRTGNKRIFAEGLMMANGVTRAPDGVIYASDDFGIGIDRIENGQVKNRWAPVVSGNGLEADRANEWLYVNTTFRPAGIDRVEIDDPSNVEAFYRSPTADMTGGPDGMEIDERDNLYSAINLAGEVWKISPEGKGCLLADGMPQASDLVFGKTKRKSRFHRGNLYVTSFTGTVTEIRGVRPRRG